MATCNEMIEGNVVAYACSLEQGHEGPHMATENERSVRERRRWETEQEAQQARATLASFQGPAETTAQRYTENPTPVPLTREQREEQRAEQAAQEATDRPRPSVLVANDDLIRSGRMHNPFDGRCNRRVEREATLPGERCYLCNPPEPEVEPEPQPVATDVTPDVTPDEVEAVRARLAQPEPTKQRPGDQVLPTVNDAEYVQERIIAKAEMLMQRGQMSKEQFDVIEKTMRESIRVGIERYGTALQPFNGRDSLQDLVDELRDGLVYGTQLLMAREAQREALVPMVRDALHRRWLEIGEANERRTPMEFCTQFAEIAVDTIIMATGPLPDGP